MDSETEIIAGKILYAIKNGAKRFREIERVTNLSSTTITKYTHDLEEEGLLILKSDKDRRKIIYQLNEAKMDEINKLIEAYLKSEEEQLEKSFLTLAKSDPEKARNVIKRLQSFLEKEIFEDEDSGK
uniref:Transcriptional regulator n=1 Tax=Archaeoglobus fulgidus TaxID=2234 RepID=A0A7J3M339_ARCFL